MRVLLISPNTLTVPYPVYPLGLDYVAGCVSEKHQVRIADMNVLSLDALEELLRDFSPEIIGLSCRNIDNTEAGDPLFFIDAYGKLAAWLRERSKAVLVCGGIDICLYALDAGVPALIDRFTAAKFARSVVEEAKSLAITKPHPFWAARMRAVTHANGGVHAG